VYLIRLINLKLNFLHSGLRYRILKIVSMIFGWSNKEFVVDFFEKKYHGILSNHIDFLTFFFGSYERGILNFLRLKILKPDMVVLDVGANIGHHTMFFSSYAKKVLSFEPYPRVRAILEEKVKFNGISNVEIIPYGLSNQNQKLEYFEPPTTNSGVGSFQPDHYSKNSRSGLVLELLNGDELLRQMNVTKIDLVKIDVEGFEHYVLEGLKQSLVDSRPIIVIEFNRETQSYCNKVESFFSLFPDSYSFWKLDKQFTSMARLESFVFESYFQGNIICFPVEKLIK
jgi:FkbM family methyltransferase